MSDETIPLTNWHQDDDLGLFFRRVEWLLSDSVLNDNIYRRNDKFIAESFRGLLVVAGMPR